MPAINHSYSHRKIAQYREENEEASARELNLEKKWFHCLKCGRKMWTDRCHRICRRCHKVNEKTRNKHQYSMPNERGVYSPQREDIFGDYSIYTDEIAKKKRQYADTNGNSRNAKTQPPAPLNGSSLDSAHYIDDPVD